MRSSSLACTCRSARSPLGCEIDRPQAVRGHHPPVVHLLPEIPQRCHVLEAPCTSYIYIVESPTANLYYPCRSVPFGTRPSPKVYRFLSQSSCPCHIGHSRRCTPASACCSSTSTSSRASATLPTSSTSTGASPAPVPRALWLRSAMTTNLMCAWRCRGIGVSLCRCAKRNELGTDADHDGSRAGGRLRSLLV